MSDMVTNDSATVTTVHDNIIDTSTQQMSFDNNDIDSISNEGDDASVTTNANKNTTDNTDNNTDTSNNNTSNLDNIQSTVTQQDRMLEAMKKDLKAKGINLNDAINEYNTYGALSNETMANLAKAGYSQDFIQGFITTRQILEQQFTNEIYKAVGGEQEYANLVAWAQNNLKDSTIKAFNKAVDSNDLDAVMLMLDGMNSRRVRTQGTRNRSILGGSSNKTNRQNGFSNRDEMIKAMADPRYYTDKNYNREVVAKLLNSKIFN